ncbi:hypothetical protein COCVIDRAFT_40026 [Bipolaris victoriae FI3]|uniref:histidine kinase n=1 Tax=Bipolaris victoriae (strain FI3) TaxID=930091 RepID=W7E8B0_BIPV3|nr:hypothetical protein COCVIDRAFT_40026 [Bipolaris victoriae FI3]
MSTELETAEHAGAKSHLSFLTEPTGDSAIDSDLQYIRELNWADTAPGPIAEWPRELLVLINLAMLSPQPQIFLLGRDSTILYNTAYGRLLRDYHPLYQGRPIALNTAMVGHGPAIPRLTQPENDGSGLDNENQIPCFFPQHGILQEVFLRATMVKLPLSLDGYHVTAYDTTQEVLQRRRERSLDHIRRASKDATDLNALWASTLRGISNGNGDISFAAIYFADSKLVREHETGFISNEISTDEFKLAGTVGSFTTPLPSRIKRGENQAWVKTIYKAVDLRVPELLHATDGSLPPEMCHASRDRCYGDDSHQAVILPSIMGKSGNVYAVLILGLAPRCPYDSSYQAWVGTLHQHFCSSVAAITIAETRRLAKENDQNLIAKEKEMLAKEMQLRQQEAVLATGKMQRMLQVIEAARLVFRIIGMSCADLLAKKASQNAYTNGKQEAFCNLSGCSRDVDVRYQTMLMELCEQDDQPLLTSHWQSLVDGRSTTLAVRFRPHGCERKWVQIACVPMLDNALGVVSITGCVAALDVQQKIEYEATADAAGASDQVRLNKSRLLNFIENANIGVLVFDEKGKPSFVNKAWFQMTGHPSTPVKSIQLRSIVFPEDVSEFDARLENVFKFRKPESFHIRLKSLRKGAPNYSEHTWVQFAAFPDMVDDGSLQTTTTITDISEFKYSELLQRAKLEEAIESKRQQENFVDMTSHEIRNPLGAVMHCADALSHSLSEMKLILDRTSRQNARDVDHKTTTKRLQECTSSMIEAADTIMACTVHQKRIIDDILSISKLDSNLLEICPSAFQVKTFLEQVESTFRFEATQAGVTFTITPDPSLTQLGVDWIEADPGRIMQVLVNLVANAIKFTKDSPKTRNVTLRVGASSSRPTDIFADLMMVASPSSSQKEEAKAAIAANGQELYLWCSVKDTGCGMDSASMKRIFSRFIQASPKTYSKYGGSGLGLFISRKLVALQGGEIGFASQENAGSTFAFYAKASRAVSPESALIVPTSPSRPTEASNTSRHPVGPQSPESRDKRQLSVLLVEDNMVNQRVLKKQLQQHGYIVHTADNGQKAFDFIKTSRHWKAYPGTTASDSCIDVILMDVEMPVMDGLQCAKMIRTAQNNGQINKHLQIVAVTANARPEQLKRATEAGMDDAISKPFRVKDLVRVIDRLGALE